jgi:prophage regulatory protein
MTIMNHADIRGRGITFSRAHLIRLEKKGLFPKRLQLSPGRVGWLESEIDRWIAERAAARDVGAAA